ncbi:rRNA methyltransferase [Dactylosporangium roseum]|uniref:rRNA methyltransferase n=1 Tax=Dactylosporangium roseum TaxID=47989 RepID=A0ABY5YYC8_9ACTN|nr:rRNA methyltransferase [Dactylosporangium roseum]UWZ34761.1 rRNA methyltransferase [Dactylosporangium roseum]
MSYRHVVVKSDYTDLASGSVLHSAPGFPAFPVRLASEIFSRAMVLRGGDDPAVVWDPCCGGGYLLSVLGLLHRGAIASLVASDIDPAALQLARENLGLLDPAALDDRARALEEQAERFGKPSYLEAAAAARRLGTALAAQGGPLTAIVRRADVFDRAGLEAVVDGAAPDIVIADVPYGEQTTWSGSAGDAGVPEMLTTVASVLTSGAVLAVSARGRKVPLGGVCRPVESFRVGTRAVALLRPTNFTGR